MADDCTRMMEEAVEAVVAGEAGVAEEAFVRTAGEKTAKGVPRVGVRALEAGRAFWAEGAKTKTVAPALMWAWVLALLWVPA